MRELSPSGRQAINNIAQRHRFSVDAVLSMLDAVMQGNGSMAQFNHPEFGGYGQWMKGGMTMVADTSNRALQERVDALCSDLTRLVASEPGLVRRGSLVPEECDWWPAELGSPTSTGAQNNVRYAYFSHARRLAVEVEGRVRVYDTLDHRIGSFSQQQSRSGSLSFFSQHGRVDLASLPVISTNGVPQSAGTPVSGKAP